MPNNINKFTTNWISSDNYTSAPHNGYYVGRTPEQQKKDIIEKKKINSKFETSKLLYKALKTQRRYSPSKTMRNCGLSLVQDQSDMKLTPIHQKVIGLKHKGVGNASGVVCNVNEHGVSVMGVGFCQSPFCVTCMGYKRTERMQRITDGLQVAREKNMHSYFVTLTIQRTHDIKQQVKDLFYGYKCLLDKIGYRTKKQGIKIYHVRNLDITFRVQQKDVYHTHLHCIFTFDKDIHEYKDKKTKVIIKDIPMMIEHAWVDIQTSKNVKASLQGQHVEKVKHNEKLSRYVSKFEGLSKELCNFAHKTGKKTKLDVKSIGFMELLGYVSQDDNKCCLVYREFLKAMKNCRTVSFSRNWKLLEAEKEEEEEETSDSEESTEQIHVSVNWFLCLGRQFDIFCLLLHKAYLTNDLVTVEKVLCEPPNIQHLDFLIDYFLIDV